MSTYNDEQLERAVDELNILEAKYELLQTIGMALLKEIYDPFLYDDSAIALLESKSPGSKKLRETMGVTIEQLRNA